jgi:hypothetical protein
MQQLLNFSSIATCCGDGKANYPPPKTYSVFIGARLPKTAPDHWFSCAMVFATMEQGVKINPRADAAGRFRKKVCDDSYSR